MTSVKIGEAIARYRKFAISLAGALGVLVAQGVFHGDALHWVTVGLAVAAAFGVRQISNAP